MSKAAIFAKVGNKVIQNSPTILSVCGVGGLVLTAVMASKATLKSEWILKKDIKSFPKEDKIQTARYLAKVYGPTIIVGAASIACILGSNHINLKRNAALATAWTFSTEMAKKYQDKVIETVGKGKEQKIRDEVHKEELANAEPETIVISDDEGKTLCYDAFTGQYFKSDIETIRRAANDVNDILNREDFASLNEFYDRIGVNIGNLGEYLGWNRYYDGLLDLDYSSQLSQKNQPCLVLSFSVDPKQNFDKSI